MSVNVEDADVVVGLVPAETVTYDAGTPFDYPAQCVLFTPDKNQPEPTQKTPPPAIFTPATG